MLFFSNILSSICRPAFLLYFLSLLFSSTLSSPLLLSLLSFSSSLLSHLILSLLLSPLLLSPLFFSPLSSHPFSSTLSSHLLLDQVDDLTAALQGRDAALTALRRLEALCIEKGLDADQIYEVNRL